MTLRRIGFEGARAKYVFGLAMMALGATATAAQPLLVGRVADAFFHHVDLVSVWLYLLMLSFLVDAAGSTIGRLALSQASERFVYNIRSVLIRRILDAGAPHVRAFDRGDINNRIVEDIPIFQRPYFSVVPEICSASLTAVLCFTGMLITSWQLTASLIALLVIFFVGLLLMLGRVRASAEYSRVTEASYSSFLYEVLYNFHAIQALGAKGFFAEKMNERAELARKAGVRLLSCTSMLLPIVSIGTQVGLVGVLILGGFLASRSEFGAPEFVSFFLYLVYAIAPLVTIATSAGELKEAQVSKGRLIEVFDALKPASEYLLRTQGNDPPAISTSGLTFGYADVLSLEFGELSFKGAGVYCLVGPNGVGKSTLLSMLSGVDEPAAGTVSVDFGESGEGGEEALGRSRPYLFVQDRDVFSMTVRENIQMGARFSDEEIGLAADSLGVRELIDSLPEGLDTRLGAEGSGLSGGERQALYAINYLLNDPRIALLDEFSTNLDQQVKERLLQLIEDRGRENLIVIVTHDPELLARFPNHVSLRTDRRKINND